MLSALHAIVRPGGRLLVELYHPGWLAAHPLKGAEDRRGATVDRWLADGRSRHCFTYSDGTVDDISFNVYLPDEFDDLLRTAGFTTLEHLTWWNQEMPPSAECARYQVVAERP